MQRRLRRSLMVLTVVVGLTVGAAASPAGASTEGAGNQDQFGTAPSLAPSLPGGYESTNTGASKQPGEPNHANNRGGRSVWYTWTPTTSGTVAISTIGSNFDTLLAVYTGNTVQTLTLVKQNDDRNSSDTTSRVQFHFTAGTKYRIAVDGYRKPTGSTPAAEGNLNLQLRMLNP